MEQQINGSKVVAIKRRTMLSVVVPVFNEHQVIMEFHQRLSTSLGSLVDTKVEIIYVNDGSTDNTKKVLLALMRQDKRAQILDLSRNFGKEAAMSAGLDSAAGDAVIIIDADLQDPPELIPEMIRQWNNGYDIINMRRLTRAGESWGKTTTANLFYRVMNRIGPVRMPHNVGDFRLLSRKAVDALKQFPERTRIMKGLFALIGFSSKEIFYHRDPRLAGTTKWGYFRLWNLALEGITSFTITPLKISSYVGILTAFMAFLYGIYVVVKTMAFGDPVAGYPSLVVIVLFLGGLQLLAIGVIGEYLGRMFVELKNRPLYLIKHKYQMSEAIAQKIALQENRP